MNHELAQFKKIGKLRTATLHLDLKPSMDLYHKLRDGDPVFAGDISRLLQAINTTARLYRQNMNRLKSQSIRNTAEIEELSAYLQDIAEDLRKGVVEAKPWGLNHLFTAFYTMRLYQEGLDLWKQLSAEDSACAEMVRSPIVTGSIIDLMMEADAPFPAIMGIYESSKDNGSSSNLEQAMIGALIKHDMITDALELFSSFLQAYPDRQYALARIHDRFVGDCTDLTTALHFFYEGIEKRTTYKATLHPAKVASLIQRVWHNDSEPNLDQLEKIWKDYILFLPRTTPEWTFSITVHLFMKAFIEFYPRPTPESVSRLKDVIQYYIQTRVDITPTFLNTVLSAVQPWGDKEVIFTLIDAFKVNNLPEDAMSARIILNSLETIDVDDNFILEKWNKLLEVQPRLTQYDVVALIRACYPPHRNDIFSTILEGLLIEDKIPDNALIGVSQTLTFSEHFIPKKNYFDTLLRSNYIEVTRDKQVHRFSPFEPVS